MSDLEEFHRELLADVQGDADAYGLFTVEAFFEKVSDLLTEAGELDAADRSYYEGTGEKGVALQIDGFGGDPRDAQGILGLIICDFESTPEVRVLLGKDIQARFKRLVEFLRHARRLEFRERLEESSPGFGVADLIATTWNDIVKIKLILVTNAEKRAKIDGLPGGSIDEKPVTYSVWDLERLRKFIRSGQAREDVEVNFEADFGSAIPVLKASMGSSSLESYVAVVQGSQLADIYDRWGPRLLEANVRSFLQARGKVNQKIRDTLEDTPEMFFSYNNGITATANAVTIRDTSSGPVLVSADNLQIVNGGQTTASIHAARRARPKRPKARLDEVFVQMKLTVVPPERTEEIVPKISEYANSQNKVNAADFFANHPFHQRMEEFSRRILAPAGQNEYRETKWFYERARGQYPDERGRRTEGERKRFDLEYPKSQYFTKTDLAKFENSWNGEPHIVSLGAQKNFGTFAKSIGDSWTRSDARFDETWYKRLIAKAIIFRRLEKIVPAQPWYDGGYRANTVTYAIAKLVSDITASGMVLNLDEIWRMQSVPPVVEAALLVAAAEARHHITHPPEGIRNMSEWAKKQACWHSFKSSQLTYDDDLGNHLIRPEDADSVVREARKEQTAITGMEAQMKVVNLGGEFWAEVSRWARINRKVTPKEAGILETCTSIPLRMPSEKQSIIAISVLERLEADGFGVDETSQAD